MNEYSVRFLKPHSLKHQGNTLLEYQAKIVKWK